MSDVSPPNGNPIIPNMGPSALGPATFITPDALLAYCSTRLRNLDTEMQKQFQDQQRNIADSQKLNDIGQKMKALWSASAGKQDGKIGSDMNLGEEGTPSNDAAKAIQAEILTIQDPQARETAQEALTALATMKGGSGFEDVKTKVFDAIDGGKQSLSQGSELGMIGLQSLMSQRQTAVQMTTNLVQAFGESLKAVAGNVGK